LAAPGDDRPARSTLIVRTGALGDVLLLRRAVATLRQAGCAVTLVAPGDAGRALVGTGPSEVARCFPSERADLARLWARDAEPPALLKSAIGPEPIVYVASTDADLAANLGRLGGRLVSSAPAPPPGVHASDWLARPLEAAGLAPAQTVAPFAFSRGEIATARPWLERLPERFLALHPGSGSPRKNWPRERFLELARSLTPADPFLVVRGPADEEAAAPLVGLPNAVLADALHPRQLGALLARAGLFVGNDSGVAHLAAAADAPVVALFGPTDPAQWAPIGRAVKTLRAEPLDALPAAGVAAEAARLWERGPRSR
jgi:ADP-heptose:LPS heptosyltransferase